MDRPPQQNIQDAFLNTARRDKQDVSIQLSDGNSITGRIRSFDKFSVLIEVDGNEILVFKHAISTITTDRKNEFRVTYLGRKTDNS